MLPDPDRIALYHFICSASLDGARLGVRTGCSRLLRVDARYTASEGLPRRDDLVEELARRPAQALNVCAVHFRYGAWIRGLSGHVDTDLPEYAARIGMAHLDIDEFDGETGSTCFPVDKDSAKLSTFIR